MDRRELESVRLAVSAALICLVLGTILTALDAVVQEVWAVIYGAVSIGITIACNIRASKEVNPNPAYYFWRYVPVTIFVIVPVLWSLYSTDEGVTFESAYRWIRLSLAFIVPMLLLFIADRKLKQIMVR